MRVRRAAVCGVVALILAVAIVAGSPADAKSPLVTLGCGDAVNTSIRLADDVGSPGSPCVAHGLVADKRGITIDLNGHTIWGNGANDVAETESGVFIEDRTDVRVTNGAVRGFERGILSANIFGGTTIDRIVAADNAVGIRVMVPKDAVVSGNVAVGNFDDGIFVDAEKAVVKGNTASNNVEEGIVVIGDGPSITGNTLAKNTGRGIVASGEHALVTKNIVTGHTDGIVTMGPLPTITANTVTGSGDDAIHVEGAFADVRGNTIVRPGEHGIDVTGSDARVAANLLIATFANSIEIDGDRFAVRANRISASNDAGIVVSGEDGRVIANRVVANRTEGITVGLAGAVEISDNYALGNGVRVLDGSGGGIFATSPGLVTGGGNFATGNDVDCLGADCHGINVPDDLPLATPGCDAEISVSIRLADDVGPCFGDGLNITGDDVVIDLNGYTIEGDEDDGDPGGGRGIDILGDRATILNGRVRNFNVGITAFDADDVTIDAVLGHHNGGENFLFFAPGAGRTISRSVSVGGAFAGFHVASSGRVTLTDIVEVDSLDTGIFAQGAVRITRAISDSAEDEAFDIAAHLGGTITDSHAVNGVGGFEISGSDVVVERNVATRNGFTNVDDPHGFDVSANDVVVRGNIAEGNRAGFNTSGAKTTLRKNLAAGNFLGAGIAATGTKTSLASNLVIGNAEHGIEVLGASMILEANRSIANDLDGIDADVDGLRVSANRAYGNGIRGIDVAGAARVLENRALGNGFATVNLSGQGIFAPGASGNGNVAYGSDDPDDCVPASLC